MSNDVPPRPTTAPKLLAYDEIAANRRRVRLLLTLFGVLLLPFAFFVAHQVAAYLVLLVFPMLVGYDAAYADPALAIAVAAFVSIQLSVLAAYLAYRGAARRVLRVAGARPLASGEATELRRAVENLCIGTGLPEPAVAVVDSPSINAFSTGLDPETSTVAVTRGALEHLDRRELEGIVAHELVQIASHDVRLGTVVAGLVRFMWLPLSVVAGLFRGIATLLRSAGLSPSAARGVLVALGVWLGLPIAGMIFMGFTMGFGMLEQDPVMGVIFLVLMAFPLYVLVVTPVAGLLMLRAISREHVSRADADALLLTRNPGGLARALTKMSVAENAAITVPPAIRPLWIADPASAAAAGWGTLLASHASLEDRIATIVRMGNVTDTELDEARAAGVLLGRKEGG